jgi:hypothetical protein
MAMGALQRHYGQQQTHVVVAYFTSGAVARLFCHVISNHCNAFFSVWQYSGMLGQA